MTRSREETLTTKPPQVRRCELKTCRKPLKRKRSASGKAEILGTWQARLYCDNACARAARRVDADAQPRLCECGALLVRKRNPSGRLEGSRDFGRRKRCVICTEAAHRLRAMSSASHQAKPRTKTPAALPKPLGATSGPLRPTKLPDPRQHASQPIPSAIPENPCFLHLDERAGSCTVCHLLSKSRTQKAKVGDTTPIWRQM